MHLTQSQFAFADSVVSKALRSSRKGSPERLAAEAVAEKWEAAIALPDRTWQNRQDRLTAIAKVAEELGLLLGYVQDGSP